jgi:hypothetical protein
VTLWLVVVIAVAVVLLALVLMGATRDPERRRIEANGHREKLARDAGIASFGLNLPWRRTRR